MHDIDEHYFDVRQAQEDGIYTKKRQRFIFTRTIGGCNMYEKNSKRKAYQQN